MLIGPVGGAPTAPPGYSGWGAGPGPQGLTNSPGTSALPGHVPSTVNHSFYIILANTGVPQRGEPVFVPPGATVSIRAHNGTSNGNTNLIRISDNPEGLGGINGDPITPDSEISWPCDNTGVIWVAGTAGDGVRVKVSAYREG